MAFHAMTSSEENKMDKVELNPVNPVEISPFANGRE